MHEPLQIAACLRGLAALGEPAILATVVRVEGSAYRREGARMLVTPAGARVGCVSGGCLERDVRSRGQRLAMGEAVLVVYDSTADADTLWSLSLGCDGRVEILIEKISPSSAERLGRHLHDNLSAGRSAGLATLLTPLGELAAGTRYYPGSDDGGSRGLAGAVPGLASVLASEDGHVGLAGGVRLLVEHVAPPQRLVIFGAGWDAVPVAAAAKQLGWHVTVVDSRRQYLTREHFPSADSLLAEVVPEVLGPETAAVVMTHDLRADADALVTLFGSEAGYVGLLGSRGRTSRLLEELRGSISPSRLEALHAPVGLDVGAEMPAEIAAAVVAEILAWRSGRCGGSLRRVPVRPDLKPVAP